MPNVRYRMSDVRYRIRYLQKLRYRRFFVRFLAIFVYDIVYDIVRHIGVFAEIVYDMQIKYWYYTTSYAYFVRFVGIVRYRTPIYTKTYADTVRCRTQYRNRRCDVRYFLPGATFAAGRTGHAPGAPTGPPRPSQMVCTASSQS